MSTLGTIREEILGDLDGLSLNTYSHFPGRIATPSATVLAGSPYLEAGESFGSHLARFEVWLSVDKGDNGSETDALDTLIETALAKLYAAEWGIEQVSQPFELAVNNGTAYTIAITVTTLVTLSS